MRRGREEIKGYKLSKRPIELVQRNLAKVVSKLKPCHKSHLTLNIESQWGIIVFIIYGKGKIQVSWKEDSIESNLTRRQSQLDQLTWHVGFSTSSAREWWHSHLPFRVVGEWMRWHSGSPAMERIRQRIWKDNYMEEYERIIIWKLQGERFLSAIRKKLIGTWAAVMDCAASGDADLSPWGVGGFGWQITEDI